METFITGIVVSVRKGEKWIHCVLDDIDDHDPRRMRVSFGGSWARKMTNLSKGSTMRLNGPADAWIQPETRRKRNSWPSKPTNRRETRLVVDDYMTSKGTVLVWDEDGEARAFANEEGCVDDSDGSRVYLEMNRVPRGKCNLLVRVLDCDWKEDRFEVTIEDSVGERGLLLAHQRQLKVSRENILRCRRVECRERGVFVGPPYASYFIVNEEKPAHPVATFTPPSSELLRAAESLRPVPTLADARSRLYGRYRDGQVVTCRARLTSFLPSLHQGLKANDGWFFVVQIQDAQTSLQVLVNRHVPLLVENLNAWILHGTELVFHLDAIRDARDDYRKRVVLVDVTTTENNLLGECIADLEEKKRPASAASTPIPNKKKKRGGTPPPMTV